MAKKSAKKQAKQKRQQQQQVKRDQARKAQANAKNAEQSSDDESPKARSQPATQVRTATSNTEKITLSKGASDLSGSASLSPSPSGLPNMGNTCYFNSVMQVLGQTYILHELLTERLKPDFIWNAKTYYLNEKTSGKKYFASEQLNSKLIVGPALESTFIKLQQEIFQRLRTNPIDLLREIRKERTQFEGWSQQDSQELLISLLDSLKKAETSRQSSALIKGLNISNPKNATDEEKEKAARFRITAKHTVLDAIFGGQLLSFIHCTVCNYRSFTFEQFMDLSLSLNLHPNNIPSQDMSTPKKFNKATNSSAPSTSKGGRKGRKQQTTKANNSGEETEDDEMPAMGSLLDDNKEDDSSNRNLTAKERKQRRAQKKAARREARINARDQAQKDQDKTTIDHLDGSQKEEDDDDDDDEDEDDSKEQDDLTAFGPENCDAVTIVKSEPTELESKDLNVSSISKSEDIKTPKVEDDDNDLSKMPDSISPLDPNPIPKEDSNSDSDNESEEEKSKKILVNVCKEEKPVFFGPLPPPASPEHKLSDSDSGCENDDDDDEGIDMTEMSLFPQEIKSTDRKLSSVSDNAKSPSTTGDSDSGQDAVSSTLNKKDHPQAQDDLSGSSTDADDGSTAIINTSTNDSSNSSSDSSILPHIEPEFRSKFYDLAMQKLAYCSKSSSQFDNRDLGTLFESFIKPEILDGANKYLCECCSKQNGGTKTYSKALRCQLIALPPPVMVIHLKRFEASGFGGRGRGFASMHKLNTSISFPERLNLSPYTSKIYESFAKFYEPDYDPEEEESKLEYRLYGVVIHSGGLRAGHYMAYVCVRPDQFYTDRLNKFLHLKPFVSNIEHILDVCYQKETKSEESQQEEEEEEEEDVSPPTTTNGDVTEPESTTINAKSTAPSDRKWFFISDSSVSTTTLENVLKDTSSPYLLFYERIC